MLPTPRIIAIDDEPKHLEGLTQGLNQYGAACLPIHFTGDTENVRGCPSVRVIFADLHLSGGVATDHAQDFSIIGGLIAETIEPSGPYMIILWTMYPDQANDLRKFLENRLENVPKPFAVQALNKNDHLDPEGDVKDIVSLVKAIEGIVAQQPQVGALLNWEERVLGAASDSVSSVMKLAHPMQEGENLNEEVGRLLARLAEAAVGKAHVQEDRFRAVNEALLPILGDRIAAMRSREDDDELWQSALGQAANGERLSLDGAAKLNRLLHVAPSNPDDKGTERGAVIALPSEFLDNAFNETFGLPQEEAAHKPFWRRRPEQNNDDPLQWVLVQTQAACDYAQTQPGPLPFHLGLCLKAASVRTGKPPAALWCSPCFEHDDAIQVLHVNARFQVSLTHEKAEPAQPLFRLREQLLNDLVYRLHSHGARPGIISFRE